MSEPTIEEMLEDPIVRLMMVRDRVRSADIYRLMAKMRHHRAARAAAGADVT